MKKAIGIIAAVLVLAASVTTFIVISHNPAKQILGKWSDSDGSSGYEFFEGGKVTNTYYRFTMFDVPLQGDYDCQYLLNKKEKTVTITGKILAWELKETYTYEFKGDTLKLTNTSSGKSITYFKQDS